MTLTFSLSKASRPQWSVDLQEGGSDAVVQRMPSSSSPQKVCGCVEVCVCGWGGAVGGTPGGTFQRSSSEINKSEIQQSLRTFSPGSSSVDVLWTSVDSATVFATDTNATHNRIAAPGCACELLRETKFAPIGSNET